jgi:membrane protease YdiL (CAAX protease family)
MDPLPKRFLALVSEIRALLRELDPRVTTIMVVSSLMVLLFEKYGRSGAFNTFIGPRIGAHPRLTVMSDCYWFACSLLMLGLVPCLSQIPFARGRSDPFELSFGDWRFGLKTALIAFAAFLPVVVIASRSESFADFYPLNSQLRGDAAAFFSGKGPDDFLMWFVPYELGYAIYFIGWEYFFRGFLTLGLYEKLGINAILISNIPFVLMHSGKPLPEALGSILGGLALGLLAVRTRSFWWGYFLHAAVALSMDACAIERRLELIGRGP